MLARPSSFEDYRNDLPAQRCHFTLWYNLLFFYFIELIIFRLLSCTHVLWTYSFSGRGVFVKNPRRYFYFPRVCQYQEQVRQQFFSNKGLFSVLGEVQQLLTSQDNGFSQSLVSRRVMQRPMCKSGTNLQWIKKLPHSSVIKDNLWKAKPRNRMQSEKVCRALIMDRLSLKVIISSLL